MDIVDDVLTSQVPEATVDVLLHALSPLLNKLPFDLVIWSQVDNLIYHYKQPEELLSENIDIQLIVTGKKDLTERDASEQSTAGSLASQRGTSFAEGNTESSDLFHSAVEDFAAPTEPHVAPMDAPERHFAKAEIQVLLVSPGFGIAERMSEAQKAFRAGKLVRYRKYIILFETNVKR